MLEKFVYALLLTVVFYTVIFVSTELGWHQYPATSFQAIGPVVTFLMLFGTVNNVLQGLGKQ